MLFIFVSEQIVVALLVQLWKLFEYFFLCTLSLVFIQKLLFIPESTYNLYLNVVYNIE